jgi:hypothetical protein
VTQHITEPPNPNCGVFVDLCTWRLWEPLSDGKFKFLGNAEPDAILALLRPIIGPLFNGAQAPRNRKRTLSNAGELVTFAEAAQRCGFARKTLYEWKRTGKLRREHGLRMLGRSPRLHWVRFQGCVERGELS